MVLLSLTFRHHHQSIGINRNDYFYTLSFLTHFSFILLKYLDYSAASDRPRRATKYQFYMNSKTVRSYTFRNVTFTVSNSSMTLLRNIIAQSELALTPRSEMREVWRKYRWNKLCPYRNPVSRRHWPEDAIPLRRLVDTPSQNMKSFAWCMA